ncbi:MAG: hypothetical protein ACK4I8_06555 [Armatimonadota bacterium]
MTVHAVKFETKSKTCEIFGKSEIRQFGKSAGRQIGRSTGWEVGRLEIHWRVVLPHDRKGSVYWRARLLPSRNFVRSAIGGLTVVASKCSIGGLLS